MWGDWCSLSSWRITMDKVDQGDQFFESPQMLAKRLGLNFSNYLLLSRALTHRSFLNEHPEALEDNERLEFLGDAILDFLVGAWLYNNYPEKAEGELTRLRSALVRTEQLSLIAKELQLGKAIRLGKGEAEGGGRNRKAILCATFEAMVGALYLDAGMDAVRDFIEPMLEPITNQIIKTRTHQDPKSMLQEWVQGMGYPPPEYRTIAANGPEHEKIFEVEVLVNHKPLGYGVGNSKQSAAKEAARNALQSLNL